MRNVNTQESELWGELLPEDRIADANSNAISNLFKQLKQAVYAANLNTEAIAEQIGTSTDEARRILNGAIDLTLSDLEVVLVAVRGLLDVNVKPASDVEAPHVQVPGSSDWKKVTAPGGQSVWDPRTLVRPQRRGVNA